MKRNLILMVTLGLFFIGLGTLLCYLNGTCKKDKEIKNNIDIVLDSYDKLEKNIEIINGEREIINQEVINNLFDENVLNEYDVWIKKLDSYKTSIKKVSNYENKIKTYCVNQTYKDSNITSKCETMINGYETVINYFVKDIDDFNKFVDTYNNQYNDKKINKYLISFNYVDINNDGKYLGK